jgi:hypothetical protein
VIRAGYDEARVIDPCQLKSLYQGFDSATDIRQYNSILWQLGLITLTAE